MAAAAQRAVQSGGFAVIFAQARTGKGSSVSQHDTHQQARPIENSMPGSETPEEEWLRLLKERVNMKFATALFAMNVTTKDKFSAKRGMNDALVQDGEVVAMLNKMHTFEAEIDTDINGEDADQLRELQIHIYENKHQIGTPAAERELEGTPVGTHAEEARNASKAIELHKQLEETQGFKVPVGGRSPVVGAPKGIRAGSKASGQCMASERAAMSATCATVGKFCTCSGAYERSTSLRGIRERETSRKMPPITFLLRKAASGLAANGKAI